PARDRTRRPRGRERGLRGDGAAGRHPHRDRVPLIRHTRARPRTSRRRGAMRVLTSRRTIRVLAALAVAGAAFGIVSAVQADIPDNGVIHGCYGKPGTPP